jgi:DNA-binding MarR family transcriptional regulator
MADQAPARGQFETLKLIKKYIAENGFSPSVADVARARNATSGSTCRMIQRLVKCGYLEREPPGWRNIIVRDTA